MELQSPLPRQPLSAGTKKISLLSRYMYVGIGVLAMFFVGLGFSYTYFIPLAAGKFSAPVIFHIHGVMYFAWILLVVAQPLLVRSGNIKLHRKIGYAGFTLAVGMFLIGIAMSVVSGTRTVAAGQAETARAFLIVPLTDMILFGTFIGLSLLNLKRSETHKRLMVLATLSILPAAFGRIFGINGIDPFTVPGFITAILLQESILILGILNDAVTRRRIHPVYIWGGPVVVIIHIIRVPLGEMNWWTSIAERIIG